MAHNLDDCTEVSYWCPISATVLGYEPNLGSSIFFAIAFGTILVASFSIGMWKRTWGFTGTMTAGLILETVGTQNVPPETPKPLPCPTSATVILGRDAPWATAGWCCGC